MQSTQLDRPESIKAVFSCWPVEYANSESGSL